MTELYIKPEPSQEETLAYITGELIEMKFQDRRLRLKLIPSGRALDATYTDDFEPVLLDNPRELIQVHGNVVYLEDGTPTSLSEVDEILEVDESQIEVLSVDFDGRSLRPNNSLSFKVIFDREAQLYEAEGPLGVLLAAETRPALEAMLQDELAMLWREYALSEPDALTSAAQRLKNEILAALEDVTDAPES